MNPESTAVIGLLRAFFADSARWPKWSKPLHLIQGALLVQGGMDVQEAARTVGTAGKRFAEIVASPDIVEAVLSIRTTEIPQERVGKLRRNVGQLVLGRAAEIAFEDICRSGIDSKEYSLVDLREGRTNTDFRLLNGGGRPLFRFNVKFFGSVFRRGAEMVDLEPNDCFPLATYKIHAALQEQDDEHLPYVFAIVGVPDLNAAAVADAISLEDVHPVACLFESEVVTRKRDFEDWLVDRIVEARSPAFTTAYGRIRNAEWYILSARRADDLLHKRLFERVYALRIPGFTRQFGGAEVDMHFSLSKDLLTLRDFLEILRKEGGGKATGLLERGTH